MDMDIVLPLIMVALLLVLIISGLPLAFCVGGAAVIMVLAFRGPGDLYPIVSGLLNQMQNFVLIAIPLFIFMAMVLAQAGIADDLYGAIHIWSGPVRGGLAAAVVITCAVFGAMCGIISGAVVAMGLIALPSMFKRGYSKQIALGSIVAAAPLGIIIPPSVLLILYGVFSATSVGRLYASGLVTGLIMAGFFIIYILAVGFFRPHQAPAIPEEERVTLKEKVKSLRYLLLPAVLIIAVIGSIISGAATPTEASAVGCVGALLCAAVKRRLNLRLLEETVKSSLNLMVMIGWIAITALAFSQVFFAVGGRDMVSSFLAFFPGGMIGAVLITLFIVFIMGMFVDPTLIIVLAAPIFVPIITKMGADPIWFGMLFCIMTEMGHFTPPFGFAMFILKGVSPPDVTIGDIYKSTWPFVAVQLCAVALFIAVPGIVTWLPDLLLG